MTAKTQVVTTTTKPAAKAATKPAPKKVEAKAKEAVKITTKAVGGTQKAGKTQAATHAPVKALTVDMVAMLSAQQAAFVARGIKYHADKGRVSVTKTGIVQVSADARKYFIARSGQQMIDKALAGLTSGDKMPNGMEFDPAPAGFRFKFAPKARDLKSGSKDSQAVFGAMLI